MKDKKIKLVQFLPLLVHAKARLVTISNLATLLMKESGDVLSSNSLFSLYVVF